MYAANGSHRTSETNCAPFFLPPPRVPSLHKKIECVWFSDAFAEHLLGAICDVVVMPLFFYFQDTKQAAHRVGRLNPRLAPLCINMFSFLFHFFCLWKICSMRNKSSVHLWWINNTYRRLNWNNPSRVRWEVPVHHMTNCSEKCEVMPSVMRIIVIHVLFKADRIHELPY